MEGRVNDIATQAREAVSQTHAQHTEALLCEPNWRRHEQDNRLPNGAAHRLEEFRKRDNRDKSDMIASDPIICSLLLRSIDIAGDDVPAQFALAHLYNIVRGDTAKYNQILKNLQNIDVFTPFYNLFTRAGSNEYVSDKSAYLLSGFFCHATDSTSFSDERFALLLKGISTSPNLSDLGRLEACSNLIKLPRYRVSTFRAAGVASLIQKALAPGVNKSSSFEYIGMFCVWVLSFDKVLASELVNDLRVVQGIRLMLSSTRVEKVVRMCVSALRQLMTVCDAAAEIAIDLNVLQSLRLLAFEKWRDPELYTEVRDAAEELAVRQAELTSFDRYLRELNVNGLKWGFLHEENFWKANVDKFDDNEFAAVGKLVSIVSDTDATAEDNFETLAVALHDVGEIARHHPIGKKILAKLNAKAKALARINHPNPNVAREALICVQKLMLDRWEDAAAAIAKN